jgi:hypothetical protein
VGKVSLGASPKFDHKVRSSQCGQLPNGDSPAARLLAQAGKEYESFDETMQFPVVGRVCYGSCSLGFARITLSSTS